jgi:hypothetical protein
MIKPAAGDVSRNIRIAVRFNAIVTDRSFRAFRRLEYKTQVFVNHEGDHYRRASPTA